MLITSLCEATAAFQKNPFSGRSLSLMLSKNALSYNLFTSFLRARGLCREVKGILTYIQYAPVPELRPSLSDARSWQIVVRRVSRHLTSSNRNRIGIQRYRLCGFVQRLFHLIAIQLLLPGRDDDSGDAIAAKIGDRAPIGHKTVDAKQQYHSGEGYGRDDRQGGGQCDKARARHAACAFGGEHGHCQERQLLRSEERRVGKSV